MIFHQMPQNAEAGAIAGTPTSAFKLLWGTLATALAVLYTAVLAPIAAIVAPFSHGFYTNSVVGRWWARMIIGTCGVKVELEGLQHIAGLKSFVLVTNHQSFFDIFAVL